MVEKYGERYPLANCIPSTISTEVSTPFASSTVITPSRFTRATASAISEPIDSSLFAEMVATCLILSSESETSSAISFNAEITAATARSIPRLIEIGSPPAATIFNPSSTMACASTVAVVVPSPAASAVLDAASRSN